MFAFFRKNKLICSVLILALGIRLLYCLVIFPTLFHKRGQELGWKIGGSLAVDPYQVIARNIVKGRGYRDDTGRINYARLPGYVYFLTLIYRLWGFELWKVQVVQSVLDTGSCLLVFLLSLRIFSNLTSGLLAAFLYAVYFKVVSLVAQMFTEPFYLFLLLLFLWFFVCSIKKNSAALFAGIFIGFMTLTRPVTLLFPVIVGCLYFWKTRSRFLSKMTLFLLGFLSLVMALFIRNYLWTGKVFFSTGGGEILYKGTRFDYSRNFRSEQERLIREVKSRFSPQHSIEDDARLKAMALDVIFRDPGGFLKRVAYRSYLFWTYPDFSTRMMAFKTVAVFIFNGFFLAFAFLGFCRAKAKNIYYQPFLWTILYFYFVHILIHSHSRYSLPLMPIIYIFAAFGLVDTLRNIRLPIQRFLQRPGAGRRDIPEQG